MPRACPAPSEEESGARTQIAINEVMSQPQAEFNQSIHRRNQL